MSGIRVLVLGASGMLGSAVARVLSDEFEFEVTVTVRDPSIASESLRSTIGDVRPFDAAVHDESDVADLLSGYHWAINAIGVIKPMIDEADWRSVSNAVTVNATFPARLAGAAERVGCRVIQIATDCVYSGTDGGYSEEDPHDPVDVYGKTKSLGEITSDHILHLRCSIIGPELGNRRSLLEWFLGNPAGATLRGFSNHGWNGVSTFHFGRICGGMVREGFHHLGVQHVVPANVVTKFELLELLAAAYGRTDLSVDAFDAPTAVDRSLVTRTPGVNRRLWKAAGYESPPTISEMITDMAALDRR